MQYHRRQDAAYVLNTQEKMILLVEQDDAVGDMFVEAISKKFSDYHIVRLPNMVAALHFTRVVQPALLLIDADLGGGGGIFLYDLLSRRSNLTHVPTIILGKQLDGSYRRELAKRKLVGLSLPMDTRLLLSTVKNALRGA
jgi:DNA-binding response OmpR family regulator